MRAAVAAIGLVTAAAAVASARPLPRGMKVVMREDRPMMKRGAVVVPLFDDDRRGHGVVRATLSADGATVRVSWEHCLERAAEEVPLAHVTARLENLAGLRLHKAKKYAEAIPHFAAAVAANHDEALFATNLLSAQAMAGQLDAADRTLATEGVRNPARFVWRLLVDPDLAAVKDRVAAVALGAAVPGTARIKDLSDTVAFSPLAGGLVAMRSYQGDGGPEAPVGEDLLIYAVATDRELLRLPVVTMASACSEGGSADDKGDALPPCTDAQRAALAARTAAADAVLAALGFAALPGALVEIPPDDDKAVLTSPDGKSRLAVTASGMTVTRGNRHQAVTPPYRTDAVVFVGDAVLLEYSLTHLAYCDDDSFRTSLMRVLPTP